MPSFVEAQLPSGPRTRVGDREAGASSATTTQFAAETSRGRHTRGSVWRESTPVANGRCCALLPAARNSRPSSRRGGAELHVAASRDAILSVSLAIFGRRENPVDRSLCAVD
jgi:hypothetical protein